LKERNSSFTLIELLIVIAIIGILAALIIISLTGIMAKTRDARRVADMHELQEAIEYYYLDHGAYPSTGGVQACLGLSTAEQCWGGPYGNATINAELQPYLSHIPLDPSYGKRIYGAYIYDSPGMYWLPSPVNSVYGKYALAFEPDDVVSIDSNPNGCLGWTWGAFDEAPGGVHCPSGGSCRQCGVLVP
jgi:type II secretion system protein G